MDPFRLHFPIEKASFSIEHGQPILLIGSCFSDEIALKFQQSGHSVAANPFGTIFHPIVIAQFITDLFNDSQTLVTSIQREDVFLAWEANSSFHAYSEKDLLEKANAIKLEWKKAIQQAHVLYITLGTAFGYELDNGSLVANCHKFPAKLFKKKLATTEEISAAFTSMLNIIKKVNPNLNVVFTVSPVRHVKDGLIENNRSKARLLEAVHTLTHQDNVTYFPSYEIVIDELRDYRFFKKDYVHPSAEAIDYVWERFSDTYFSEKTKAFNKEVASFMAMKHHKILFPESQATRQFLNSLQEQEQKLIAKGAKIRD